MDYLEEPDIFHDVFGHVPLLADPVYSSFMQAYGKGGQRATSLGRLPNLARLYWYTVEFGLIRTVAGLRIFGAGIMSSTTESVFALESDSPNRIAFDLERVMRTKYLIDDFQRTYFVIDSFVDQLVDAVPGFQKDGIQQQLEQIAALLQHNLLLAMATFALRWSGRLSLAAKASLRARGNPSRTSDGSKRWRRLPTCPEFVETNPCCETER
jgi:monomeric phenylalanine-4-hydroxylase